MIAKGQIWKWDDSRVEVIRQSSSNTFDVKFIDGPRKGMMSEWREYDFSSDFGVVLDETSNVKQILERYGE
jgi:hypothetical protein